MLYYQYEALCPIPTHLVYTSARKERTLQIQQTIILPP